MTNKHTLYMRRWRAKNREKDRTYMQKWREENKERINQYRKQYYKKNKDKELARSIQWYKDNPERKKANWKARAASRKYPGKLSVKDVLEIIERGNRTCHWCGKQNLTNRDLTIEHLKPINKKKYIVLACLSCNCSRLPQNNRTKKVTEEEKRQGQKKRWNKWYKKHGKEAGRKYRDQHRLKLRKYQREYMRKRRAKI